MTRCLALALVVNSTAAASVCVCVARLPHEGERYSANPVIDRPDLFSGVLASARDQACPAARLARPNRVTRVSLLRFPTSMALKNHVRLHPVREDREIAASTRRRGKAIYDR
jgi:hypothetical protein